MEILYSEIVGTSIFEDDAPRPFTTVKDVVLDPEMRGRLIALVVNVNRKKVLSPVDIISWKNVIKVHSSGDITDAENILRVDEVLKNGVVFVGNRVETENGEYLGKVNDLEINTNTFDLKRIFIAKTFLGLIRYESRIISAKDIVEVKADKIIVKSGMKTVKEEAKETVRDMAEA